MWENTILVVVDPAAGAHQPALERAAWLAKQAEGRLELFACEWDPDIDAGRAGPGSRERLLKQRQHKLEELAAPLRQQGLTVTVDVVWDHPFFGPLNWREWLLFLRVHDLDHARQVASINEALAAAR